ncbi:MAG: TetR/AcrR family transcriptional regulator [Bacteroidetes bacterium]|nr:MAG: TetR/AcrR family transcriptional regulator [Bacteroidota bacterium]
MAIKDRKEREKKEMQALILEAAKELFLREGYDKTSIRNIAEKIEYSPGTIYQYFEDKDDIFFALHFFAFQDLLAEMDKNCQFKNPLDNLLAIGKTYINFALQNPELYDLMFVMRAPMCALQSKKEQLFKKISEENAENSSMQWEEGFAAFDRLKNIMQACINENLIKFDNVDVASVNMWASVHGLASLYIRDRFQMFSQEIVTNLMEKCLFDMIEAIKK